MIAIAILVDIPKDPLTYHIAMDTAVRLTDGRPTYAHIAGVFLDAAMGLPLCIEVSCSCQVLGLID